LAQALVRAGLAIVRWTGGPPAAVDAEDLSKEPRRGRELVGLQVEDPGTVSLSDGASLGEP
jgi:hypothetical protein